MTNNTLAASAALVEHLLDPGTDSRLFLLYGHGEAGKSTTALLTGLALTLEHDQPVFYCLRNHRRDAEPETHAIELLAQRYRLRPPGVFARQEGEWTFPEWVEQTRVKLGADRYTDILAAPALERLNNLYVLNAFGSGLAQVEEEWQPWATAQRDAGKPSPLLILDGLYGSHETREVLNLLGRGGCTILVVENSEMWQGEGEQAIQHLLCFAEGSCRMTEHRFAYRDREHRVEAWTEFEERGKRVRRFIAEDARREELWSEHEGPGNAA